MSDLKPLLDRAADEAPDFRPDAAAVLTRGRSLRRRDRMLRGIGTVAALAVVGGIGAVGIQQFSGPADPGTMVAGQPQAPVTTKPATPPSAPPSSETPSAESRTYNTWVDATVKALFERHGRVALDPHDLEDNTVVGTGRLTDAKGATGFTYLVERGQDPNDPESRGQEFPTSCAAVIVKDTCQVRGNGDLLVTYVNQGYAGSRDLGDRQATAVLYRKADRAIIQLTSANGPGEKLAPTRKAPALSTAQLSALVSDPVWAGIPFPKTK